MTYPESPTGLLDDVDGLQISAAFKAEHGIHCQLSKVVLVMRQDL